MDSCSVVGTGGLGRSEEGVLPSRLRSVSRCSEGRELQGEEMKSGKAEDFIPTPRESGEGGGREEGEMTVVVQVSGWRLVEEGRRAGFVLAVG